MIFLPSSSLLSAASFSLLDFHSSSSPLCLPFLPALHQEHFCSVYSPKLWLPNKVKPNLSSLSSAPSHPIWKSFFPCVPGVFTGVLHAGNCTLSWWWCTWFLMLIKQTAKYIKISDLWEHPMWLMKCQKYMCMLQSSFAWLFVFNCTTKDIWNMLENRSKVFSTTFVQFRDLKQSWNIFRHFCWYDLLIYSFW